MSSQWLSGKSGTTECYNWEMEQRTLLSPYIVGFDICEHISCPCTKTNNFSRYIVWLGSFHINQCLHWNQAESNSLWELEISVLRPLPVRAEGYISILITHHFIWSFQIDHPLSKFFEGLPHQQPFYLKWLLPTVCGYKIIFDFLYHIYIYIYIHMFENNVS